MTKTARSVIKNAHNYNRNARPVINKVWDYNKTAQIITALIHEYWIIYLAPISFLYPGSKDFFIHGVDLPKFTGKAAFLSQVKYQEIPAALILFVKVIT